MVPGFHKEIYDINTIKHWNNFLKGAAMILPNKHLSQERSLLTIGAKLLNLLSQPKTVSALWEEISSSLSSKGQKKTTLRYDAYILTLDLLFLIGAIELQEGILRRRTL